jgi:hypothetical protein
MTLSDNLRVSASPCGASQFTRTHATVRILELGAPSNSQLINTSNASGNVNPGVILASATALAFVVATQRFLNREA